MHYSNVNGENHSCVAEMPQASINEIEVLTFKYVSLKE
jgi:hypothetical protein